MQVNSDSVELINTVSTGRSTLTPHPIMIDADQSTCTVEPLDQVDLLLAPLGQLLISASEMGIVLYTSGTLDSVLIKEVFLAMHGGCSYFVFQVHYFIGQCNVISG